MKKLLSLALVEILLIHPQRKIISKLKFVPTAILFLQANINLLIPVAGLIALNGGLVYSQKLLIFVAELRFLPYYEYIYLNLRRKSVDEYQTVDGLASVKLVEKRSKFLGFISPVSTNHEANSFIFKLKEEHKDARHHVYAYALYENNFSKYSDDGEPQGTAGLPILELIKKNKLLDCIVVVVRYFGGILLGTGLLAYVYKNATKMVIESSKIVTMYCCYNLLLSCGYGDYGRISGLIFEMGGEIDSTYFTENVKINFHIKQSYFKKFCNKLSDQTKGNLQPTITGEGFKKLPNV
jgi:uncharacterized YigZ family protein